MGDIIDEKLTWKEHIEAVRKRCFGYLARLRKIRNIVPPTMIRRLYNAMVLPDHLDYCSVAWMEYAKSLQLKIEHIIQNYEMRIILSKVL